LGSEMSLWPEFTSPPCGHPEKPGIPYKEELDSQLREAECLPSLICLISQELMVPFTHTSPRRAAKTPSP
jgi:hypothetical protein